MFGRDGIPRPDDNTPEEERARRHDPHTRSLLGVGFASGAVALVQAAAVAADQREWTFISPLVAIVPMAVAYLIVLVPIARGRRWGALVATILAIIGILGSLVTIVGLDATGLAGSGMSNSALAAGVRPSWISIDLALALVLVNLFWIETAYPRRRAVRITLFAVVAAVFAIELAVAFLTGTADGLAVGRGCLVIVAALGGLVWAVRHRP
jgi:hypothetical protein